MSLKFEDALILGILNSGVDLITGFPGFPITDIFEKLKKTECKCIIRWCINETIALENAIGASFAGARSIVLMKNHGTNTVQDALINFSYIGAGGGVLLISGDDVGVIASQNETDSRLFGPLNKIPVLEPADIEDAYSFVSSGLQLSENYKTPVILRITGGQLQQEGCMSNKVVCSPKLDQIDQFKFDPSRKKYFIGPYYYSGMQFSMLKRIGDLAETEQGQFNRIIAGTDEVALICSGECYNLVKSLFPKANILKLGLVYPISRPDLERFLKLHLIKSIHVVEQTEPLIETQIKEYYLQMILKKDHLDETKTSIGITKLSSSENITKHYFNRAKLHHSDNVTSLLDANKGEGIDGIKDVSLCPACPARSILISLKLLGIRVIGDAGCTALGCLPPFESVHAGACMGSGIGIASGINLISENKVAALVGDSAFFHSGLQGLLNEIDYATDLLVILFNNSKAGMTGGQLTIGSMKNIHDFSRKIAGLIHEAGIRKENIKILKNGLLIQKVYEEISNFYHHLKGLRVLIVEGDCPYSLRYFSSERCLTGPNKIIKGLLTDPGCFAAEKIDNEVYKLSIEMCRSCKICRWLLKINKEFQ